MSFKIKRRISSVSDRDPLFLPPNNFRTSPTERIADAFKDVLQKRSLWSNRFDYIQRVRVTNEDLRKSIRAGVQKEVLSDIRGLLFPHDQSAHGIPRELSDGCSLEERKLFMRSCFRFGVPLADGYHHDVQFAGRNLSGTQFDCARAGILELTCTHANVYPNDYVRPSK